MIKHPWDIILSIAALVLLATVTVLAALYLDPSRSTAGARMGSAPEQPFLLTGPERAFLADLGDHVPNSGTREHEYLALAHSWCGSVRSGVSVKTALDRLYVLIVPLDIGRDAVKPMVGAATLRMCPEQSAKLDHYYQGE